MFSNDGRRYPCLNFASLAVLTTITSKRTFGTMSCIINPGFTSLTSGREWTLNCKFYWYSKFIISHSLYFTDILGTFNLVQVHTFQSMILIFGWNNFKDVLSLKIPDKHTYIQVSGWLIERLRRVGGWGRGAGYGH